jgi:hypothetical protein
MNVNDLENGKTTISVAGEEIEVNISDSVKDTLKKVLQDKGIDSFTILVDGKEVTSTSDLPESFDEHEVEVKRYVKAGC